MEFGPFLTHLLNNKNLTRAEVAKRLGKSETYVSFLCAGKRPPPRSLAAMKELAEAVGASPEEEDKLMDYSIERAVGKKFSRLVDKATLTGIKPDPESLPAGAKIVSTDPKDYDHVPLLGNCPASKKAWHLDEVEAYHPILKSVTRGRRIYLLRAAGDSMDQAGIKDQDLMVVDADSQAANGSIVVVCVDHEYTVKRFYKTGDKVTLIPNSSNPKHQPMEFDATTCDIRLRGVVLGVHEPFRSIK